MRARTLVLVNGQSNERGTPESTSSALAWQTIHALPMRDPVAPSGGAASIWTVAADNAARLTGHDVLVRNMAVGSTSLPDTWIGRAKGWAASRDETIGQIVLPGNGYRYRVTVGGACGADEPIWPTSVSNTVVSGSATYRCEGVVTASDAVDHIYEEGESGFDPAGLLATSIDNIRGKWDKVVAVLALGQRDAATGTTRAVWEFAMQRWIDFYRSRDIMVIVGFTCASTSRQAAYDSVLIPGWMNVMAANASDTGVLTGPDLSQHAWTLHDNVHMTAASLRKAGRMLWGPALAAALDI